MQIRLFIFGPPASSTENRFPILQPGDRIKLSRGYGCPQATDDAEHVVAWRTTLGGVLLANGTCICCQHAGGVELIPAEKVPVVLSERARALLTSAGLIDQFEAHVAASAGRPTV